MKYIASPELLAAKDVAQFLNRPLLLSGEPGTGKTTFARQYLKEEEKYALYTFNTKSISQATDLFYYYDTISHFANKEKHVLNFLKLEALGIAIIKAMGVEKARAQLEDHLKTDIVFQSLGKGENPNTDKDACVEKQVELIDNFFKPCLDDNEKKQYLVLIDEIDKAPRDFPNDILNEIENYEFKIKEIGIDFSIKDNPDLKQKIFVLLTSNFEKNLPDAFLRRCIYHHIKFPTDNDLIDIVKAHIENADWETNKERIGERVAEIQSLREINTIQKKPATSEIIDCIKYLIKKKELHKPIKGNPAALATIIKRYSDLQSL